MSVRALIFERRSAQTNVGGYRSDYKTSLASLFRVRRDAMETVPQGIAAPGETVALRLSCSAHWHSPHANRRIRGKPRHPERRVSIVLYCRPGGAEVGWSGEIQIGGHQPRLSRSRISTTANRVAGSA